MPIVLGPRDCEECADGAFLTLGQLCTWCMRSQIELSEVEAGMLVQSSLPPYNWGEVVSVEGRKVTFDSGEIWDGPDPLTDAGVGIASLCGPTRRGRAAMLIRSEGPAA